MEANHEKIMASLSLELHGRSQRRGKPTSSLPLRISKRVLGRVSVPLWGIGLGVAGGVVLGVVFGSRRPSAPNVTAVPTSLPVADAPLTSPPTSPNASLAPTLAPTVASTLVPEAPGGPSFDQLYIGTTSGTKDQREAYWKTVAKTKVSWRGDFVQLGASPGGPLTLRCKSGVNSVLVTIALSTSPPQTLAAMQENQSIPVEGILESYSEQGYALLEGHVSG